MNTAPDPMPPSPRVHLRLVHSAPPSAPHTESVRRLRHLIEKDGPVNYPANVARPRTRADCENGLRPCPFVSCKHHLYLDVHPTTGAIKKNFPDREPDALVKSCALDVADEGGATLATVGRALNITRERARQLEMRAFRRIAAGHPELAGLLEDVASVHHD